MVGSGRGALLAPFVGHNWVAIGPMGGELFAPIGAFAYSRRSVLSGSGGDSRHRVTQRTSNLDPVPAESVGQEETYERGQSR